MYLRTNARRSVSVARGPKINTAWVTMGVSSTVVGGAAGAQTLDLGSGAKSILAVQNLKGIKVLRIQGRVVVVPTVAPAAGLKDTFNMGICVANALLTPQQIDPSLSTTRDTVSWIYYDCVPQPYVAAPVGASQTLEANRLIRRSKRRGGALRVFRNEGDTLLFAQSSAGTESWSIAGYVRVLYGLT